MKTKRKRKRIELHPGSVPHPHPTNFVPMQWNFGGSCSVLLNVSGWAAWPLLILSGLIGHALFIALVRLFKPERDGKGIFVGDPKLMAVCGNYALFRAWRWPGISVYGALTQGQRQVFVSGTVSTGPA